MTTPLKINASGDTSQFKSGDSVPVSFGGTGATTQAGAQTALGLTPGTNVQAYSTVLTNVAALGAGMVSLDASGNAYAVTMVGVAGRIVVTNGAGGAAVPSFDLATVGTPVTAGLVKVTTDAYGRITATVNVAASDLTALLNSTYAPLASPTFTGTVTVPTPVNATDAATKAYVDAAATGTSKLVADYATTAALPANTYNNGSSGVNATLTATANGALPAQDGQTPLAGDTILVKNEAAGANNGLYTVTAVGDGTHPYILTRGAGLDQSSEFGGSIIVVESGTLQHGSLWMCTPNNPTVGTTAIVFTQVNTGTALTAGNGIAITTGVVSVQTASSARIAVSGAGVDLAASGVTVGTYTKLTVDQYGRITSGATAAPADIGAQPASAELTGLAGQAATGIVARTAAGTYADRTIQGTAGRVAVTSGDGVAGNPTVDLSTVAGLTPGTFNQVTVDAYGRVTTGTAVDEAALMSQFTNNEASSIPFGTPVYISGANLANKASSGAMPGARVIGLVADTTIAASASGNFVTAGALTGTTTQWDAITGGSGGLTPGTVYFLSATAGQLTTAVPSTGYLSAVGVATSTTTMQIQLRAPIAL